MKEERHYRIQEHERACALCVHHDVIIEPYNNVNGEKIDICVLDYEHVDANGVCVKFQKA